MTPSSESIHSSVSSGSMSGSWLGRPSLITGRLRSVATGLPYRDGLRVAGERMVAVIARAHLVDLGTRRRRALVSSCPSLAPGVTPTGLNAIRNTYWSVVREREERACEPRSRNEGRVGARGTASQTG